MADAATEIPISPGCRIPILVIFLLVCLSITVHVMSRFKELVSKKQLSWKSGMGFEVVRYTLLPRESSIISLERSSLRPPTPILRAKPENFPDSEGVLSAVVAGESKAVG
jgi:hypothetical protein